MKMYNGLFAPEPTMEARPVDRMRAECYRRITGCEGGPICSECLFDFGLTNNKIDQVAVFLEWEKEQKEPKKPLSHILPTS